MNFDARSRSSESAMKGCSVLITKNEFAVLAALEREPGTSQRAIAARKAMSLGSVNAAYKALVDKPGRSLKRSTVTAVPCGISSYRNSSIFSGVP